MPLCSYDRQQEVGDGLGLLVLGILDDLQVFPEGIDTLMVAAVEQHMGAEEGVQKGAGQVVGRVESIFSRMPVQGTVGYFPDRAAEIEVDELHAFADAQYRFLLPAEQVESVELFQIEGRVRGVVSGAGNRQIRFERDGSRIRILAVLNSGGAERILGITAAGGKRSHKRFVTGKGSGHVASAGQQQAVESVGMLLDIGSIREDYSLAGYVLQSGLIIFMQGRRTDDGNFFHGGSPGDSCFIICGDGGRCAEKRGLGRKNSRC